MHRASWKGLLSLLPCRWPCPHMHASNHGPALTSRSLDEPIFSGVRAPSCGRSMAEGTARCDVTVAGCGVCSCRARAVQICRGNSALRCGDGRLERLPLPCLPATTRNPPRCGTKLSIPDPGRSAADNPPCLGSLYSLATYFSSACISAYHPCSQTLILSTHHALGVNLQHRHAYQKLKPESQELH